MMKRKVKMNLIDQVVYICPFLSPYDEKNDYLISSYSSQDEVLTDSGIEIKRSVQDYPITPESVNSYADGTNYRNDINAAVSRSAPGGNLGDVASIQALLSSCPEDVLSMLKSFSEKISSNSVKSDVKSDDFVEGGNNG